MNAPTTAVATRPEPRAALVTGSEVAAIIPRNIEEMFRLAGAIHQSGLAPATLKSPDQIMVAIMAGAELGLAPFQSLQSFAVINGRPALWGDGLLAIVLAQGFKVEEWFDAEAAPTRAFCRVTRPDTGQVTERTYSVDDAKAANLLGKTGPWQTNRKRMLQMRARAFALRDAAADVLRGFQVREEVEDYEVGQVRDVTPRSTGMRARLEARTPTGGFDPEHVTAALDEALEGDRLPAHDPDTGEIVDAVIDPPADDGLPIRDDGLEVTEAGQPAPAAASGLTLTQRKEAYLARLRDAKTTIKLRSIREANHALRADLDKADPEEGAIEVEDEFNRLYSVLEDAGQR